MTTPATVEDEKDDDHVRPLGYGDIEVRAVTTFLTACGAFSSSAMPISSASKDGRDG